MHAINLGVLYDVNGACMKLGIRISNKFAGACRCNVNWSQLFMLLRLLRIALCESSYWGPGVDLQSHLDLAYDAFKAFTRAEKINCSQPPFKVRSVAKSFRLRRYVLRHWFVVRFFPRAFIYMLNIDRYFTAPCSPAKVVKKGGQVMFTCKAYNGRVVLEFLCRCINDLASKRDDDDRLAMLASCACLGL